MPNSKSWHYRGTFLARFGKNVLSFWRKEMQSNAGVVIFVGMFSFFLSIFLLFYLFFSFLSFEIFLNLLKA